MDAKKKRAKAMKRPRMPWELEMAFWDFLIGTGSRRILAAITSTEKRIMATLAEHAQQLRDLKEQNAKAAAEQAAALQALKDALEAAGNTTPEIDAAMADLAASIQADDDLNPDAPPPVEPPTP